MKKVFIPVIILAIFLCGCSGEGLVPRWSEDEGEEEPGIIEDINEKLKQRYP